MSLPSDSSITNCAAYRNLNLADLITYLQVPLVRCNYSDLGWLAHLSPARSGSIIARDT